MRTSPSDPGHDHLHAMQFRAPPPQIRDRRPAQPPASSDRDCPLDTAVVCCLWHVGGTTGENDGARTWPLWLQLYCWVRPVLGDHRLVGKSPRARGSRRTASPRFCASSRELRLGVPQGPVVVLHRGWEELDRQQLSSGWAGKVDGEATCRRSRRPLQFVPRYHPRGPSAVSREQASRQSEADLESPAREHG
jgi:hypothetical protein